MPLTEQIYCIHFMKDSKAHDKLALLKLLKIQDAHKITSNVTLRSLCPESEALPELRTEGYMVLPKLRHW